jgi:hypothetical protein
VLDVIHPHQLHHGLGQLIARELQFHAINLAGVHQTVGMLSKTEDAGALRRVIAADAFKKARSVTNHMRRHVYGGFAPRDEFPVVPNFFEMLYRHAILPNPYSLARDLPAAAPSCLIASMAHLLKL